MRHQVAQHGKTFGPQVAHRGAHPEPLVRQIQPPGGLLEHSFTPVWRPPFVTALAPEDRCHLNGLCMVAGKPKYVTALGATDTPGGWRANKARGGILMDVETNEVVLRGLSMPHSPRWYQDRLWVLESGEGSLAWGMSRPRSCTRRYACRGLRAAWRSAAR
jgi:uncharacterized protein (TIGR03032 family)